MPGTATFHLGSASERTETHLCAYRYGATQPRSALHPPDGCFRAQQLRSAPNRAPALCSNANCSFTGGSGKADKLPRQSCNTSPHSQTLFCSFRCHDGLIPMKSPQIFIQTRPTHHPHLRESPLLLAAPLGQGCRDKACRTPKDCCWSSRQHLQVSMPPVHSECCKEAALLHSTPEPSTLCL